MPGILIKNLPAELHQELKRRARENRRSMNREAIVLLERSLLGDASRALKRPLPKPVKGKFPITQKFLNWAKSKGRE